MNATLHTVTSMGKIELHDVLERESNALSIEDGDSNSVTLFMTLNQLEVLAYKILDYKDAQEGLI